MTEKEPIMTKIAYYPGCTLKNKARALDEEARAAARLLGYEFEEIDEWQCCGGAFTTSRDEIATKLAAARALTWARDHGGRVVTVCSACYNVLKQTNAAFRTDSEFAAKVSRYEKTDPPYRGEAEVVHWFELLRDEIGFDKLRAAVKKPLKGRKIAPYYGCLLLRPSETLAFDSPENPTVMEDFIRALGAEPVRYAMRNECCGGYLTLEDRDAAKKRSAAVLSSAVEMGADCMITACPLCLYNLTKNAAGPLEIRYFTDVLAEALGLKEGGENA